MFWQLLISEFAKLEIISTFQGSFFTDFCHSSVNAKWIITETRPGDNFYCGRMENYANAGKIFSAILLNSTKTYFWLSVVFLVLLGVAPIRFSTNFPIDFIYQVQVPS